MDQALTTLRLTWRWRRRYPPALVLPLLAMAGLTLADWYTDVLADVAYGVGLRFFRDPYSATARFLVQGAFEALYSAAWAAAAATILSTIAEQPAAPRWLPEQRTLPLIGALVVTELVGLAITSYARDHARAYARGFGYDWFQRNESAVEQVLLVAQFIDLAYPAATVVAIIAARRIFATPSARPTQPMAERVVNAALLVVVLSSTFSLAEAILLDYLPAAQTGARSRSLAGNPIVLVTDLMAIALMTSVFATAVAVGAFGRPLPAKG